MTVPLAFLLFGLGTPVAVATFAFLTVKDRDPTRPRMFTVIRNVIVTLACLVSLIPAILTTYGVFWVIDVHNLWLKP